LPDRICCICTTSRVGWASKSSAPQKKIASDDRMSIINTNALRAKRSFIKPVDGE
jgi:hypothetical protein